MIPTNVSKEIKSKNTSGSKHQKMPFVTKQRVFEKANCRRRRCQLLFNTRNQSLKSYSTKAIDHYRAFNLIMLSNGLFYIIQRIFTSEVSYMSGKSSISWMRPCFVVLRHRNSVHIICWCTQVVMAYHLS